jgi:S-adenosylmethionine-dependent methyltransferase
MERIRFWGIDSVRFHSALFDEAAWHAHDEPIDGILLTASLEHMTHSEALDILRLCGRALRPGGVLVICETPNRFTLVDEHTSQIPLFSMLPRQIQVEYAARSPRHAFKQTMADARNQGVEQACMLMTRWGSGVSFHEFEIAFGENVHSLVTLDGYEPEMTSFFTVTDRDLQIERLFSDSGVRVNRAFTRHYLNLALEKPPA